MNHLQPMWNGTFRSPQSLISHREPTSDYGVPLCRNAFQNTGPTVLSTIPDQINRYRITDR
jgi:hypothetical protein